jgi:hypothetical protein
MRSPREYHTPTGPRPTPESVPDFIGQVLVVMHSRVRYCRGVVRGGKRGGWGGGGGGKSGKAAEKRGSGGGWLCRSSRGRSLAAAQGGSRNSRSKAFRGGTGPGAGGRGREGRTAAAAAAWEARARKEREEAEEEKEEEEEEEEGGGRRSGAHSTRQRVNPRVKFE